MICKNCGKENTEGVKFCMACGQPMPEVTPAAEAGEQNQQVNSQPMGQPAAVSGMPTAVTGQQGGQFGAANGAQANIPGAPGGMPTGQPMQPNGMPVGPMGQPMQPNGMPVGPMGQPMQPNGMHGMPGGRPMQTGPMYQVPPMQAVPSAQPKKGNSGVKALIIIIVVLLLLCVGILATLGISKRMKENKFNNLLETAEECMEDGDYEEAVDYYLDALEINADNKDAINGLTDAYVDWAYALAADGDYEGALEVLENADSQAAKKRIKAAIEEIEAAMVSGGYNWSDADFVMQGSESVTVENGGMMFVEGDWTGYINTITYYTEEFEEGLATARGLEVGMTLADYQSLYPVENGYAIWEENYTNYGYTTYMEAYTGQSAREMYEDGADDVWLDLGWCKEDGAWRIMTDMEVRDTWFCDAPLRDYGEIVILSVNFNYNDKIQCIYIYHVPYDDVWVEYQDWAD
ncbi:MAG: zinc-ribbon domain-containing protein [Lachnospiraceae bacterium]|nr:zinc-ribbon domain-containing protein [Lachnospiraceae bacterium]